MTYEDERDLDDPRTADAPEESQAPEQADSEHEEAANAPADEADEASESGEESDKAADGEEAPEDELQQQIAKLGDELALARADLYNLNQQYTNYVRRTKEAAPGYRAQGQAEVLESLIPVLDDIQAARDAGDLTDGPFAAIAEKLERTLQTNFKMERFGEQGDEFDPNHHDALMAQDSADVEIATVAQVLQPGYRIEDRVLRPTKVMVHNPA